MRPPPAARAASRWTPRPSGCVERAPATRLDRSPAGAARPSPCARPPTSTPAAPSTTSPPSSIRGSRQRRGAGRARRSTSRSWGSTSSSPRSMAPSYWIIEANERPGLANHEPQPTAERFVDLAFPADRKCLRPRSMPADLDQVPQAASARGAQPNATSTGTTEQPMKQPADRHRVPASSRCSSCSRSPAPAATPTASSTTSASELEKLGISVRAHPPRRDARHHRGRGQPNPSRAIVSHLDTLGAMVKSLKHNGRCDIVPIGHWSSSLRRGRPGHHLHRRPRPAAAAPSCR